MIHIIINVGFFYSVPRNFYPWNIYVVAWEVKTSFPQQRLYVLSRDASFFFSKTCMYVNVNDNDKYAMLY